MHKFLAFLTNYFICLNSLIKVSLTYDTFQVNYVLYTLPSTPNDSFLLLYVVSIMVIIIRNGIGDPSSNPEQCWLCFILC